jgi:hypothetical protein
MLDQALMPLIQEPFFFNKKKNKNKINDVFKKTKIMIKNFKAKI